MTNLTRIAITARKFIRYAIYLTIFLIIARIVLNIGIGIYNIIFPKPPPAPTVAYGKLPKLVFPDKNDLPTITYTIQTATGDLPKLANQAKVYFMPKFASGFDSLDDTKEKAGSMGFPIQKEKISDTLYSFTDNPGFSTLQINTISKLFTISYDLSADPSPLSTRPPAPEIAASVSRSILSSASLLPPDLTGPTTNDFLKVESQKVVPALSLSDASFVRVNLFRKDYDELPSMTASPGQANVWFMVGGSNKIVAAQYHYFPVDEEQSSTYPIKTPQQAVDELNKGEGYVANLGLNTDGKVTIRKIYLGYFDSGKEQDFYQPIFIFEGDRSFIGYVPAVTSEYYGQ